jgi:undecaprenyl diphosphate synthase
MNALNHIAFIMDGNGRWGLRKKKNRNYGHFKGVETVKKIVQASIEYKVPIVTFYVFSTENWKRPKNEINFLFNLIGIYFKQELKNIVDKGIKIINIGKINILPQKIKKIIKFTELKTKKNKKITVNLAINYGSKNEIIDAVKNLSKKQKKITKKNIENTLRLKLPHPDILIRTGGQKRLSNFLLWQLAYTELFFLEKLWPDFSKKDLKEIINKFKKIKRNYGGINSL